MCGCSRWAKATLGSIALVGLLGGPVAASDAGRVDLLAAEAARLLQVPSPMDASAVPWSAFVALLGGTMAAAFLGTFLGTRQSVAVPRGGKNWREVTYRFQSRDPLRFKKETLARMSGILADLENLGSDLRNGNGESNETVPRPAPVSTSASAPPPATPDKPGRRVTFARSRETVPHATPRARGADRQRAYGQARQLLDEGRDPITVARMTGLKAVEVDLLGVASASGVTANGGR